MEMPGTHGITNLVELKKLSAKTPVIMFSTLALRGAHATRDALATAWQPLQPDFPVPIVIVRHSPPMLTTTTVGWRSADELPRSYKDGEELAATAGGPLASRWWVSVTCYRSPSTCQDRPRGIFVRGTARSHAPQDGGIDRKPKVFAHRLGIDRLKHLLLALRGPRKRLPTIYQQVPNATLPLQVLIDLLL